MIIKNADGEDVEVFTDEEVKARETAAIETYKQENPDKSEEITKLQTDLAKANEDLAKFAGDDKSQNFKNLREAKEAAEKALEDFKTEVDGKIDSAKKEILTGVNQEHYDSSIKALADGDEELQKKIELEYKRLNDPADTKEQITKKLTDAYVLATKPEDTDALNSTVISSGGASKPKINSNQKFSSDEKKLAQQMADAGGLGKLEDKDFQ